MKSVYDPCFVVFCVWVTVNLTHIIQGYFKVTPQRIDTTTQQHTMKPCASLKGYIVYLWRSFLPTWTFLSWIKNILTDAIFQSQCNYFLITMVTVYITILHALRRLQRFNMNQILNLLETHPPAFWGQLRDVYCEHFGENMPCYSGIVLYYEWHYSITATVISAIMVILIVDWSLWPCAKMLRNVMFRSFILR